MKKLSGFHQYVAKAEEALGVKIDCKIDKFGRYIVIAGGEEFTCYDMENVLIFLDGLKAGYLLAKVQLTKNKRKVRDNGKASKI